MVLECRHHLPRYRAAGLSRQWGWHRPLSVCLWCRSLLRRYPAGFPAPQKRRPRLVLECRHHLPRYRAAGLSRQWGWHRPLSVCLWCRSLLRRYPAGFPAPQKRRPRLVLECRHHLPRYRAAGLSRQWGWHRPLSVCLWCRSLLRRYPAGFPAPQKRRPRLVLECRHHLPRYRAAGLSRQWGWHRPLSVCLWCRSPLIPRALRRKHHCRVPRKLPSVLSFWQPDILSQDLPYRRGALRFHRLSGQGLCLALR